MISTKTNGLARFTQQHGNALVKLRPTEAPSALSRQVRRSDEHGDHQPDRLAPLSREGTEQGGEVPEESLQTLAASAKARTTGDGMARAGSIEQLIEAYLSHLVDQRCTVATLRWHRYHLTRFAAWARGHASTPYPAAWARDHQDHRLVRRYLSEVGRQTTARGQQRSAASLKSIQSSLRSFCRWLHTTGRLETDLLAGASSPRLPQTLKETFSPDEIARLLTAAATHSRHPLRDVALIRFLLDTGCRAAEVCNLRATDVDWAARQAKVAGKGRKERFVFFSASVADAMRRYRDEERQGRTPYFFESAGSTAGKPFTPSGLLSLCRRLGQHAGVHANPHKFRHTFAITYLRAGGDVFALQKRLGHAQLAMSEHYAKHATEDLRREHDEHSPDQFFVRQASSGSQGAMQGQGEPGVR